MEMCKETKKNDNYIVDTNLRFIQERGGEFYLSGICRNLFCVNQIYPFN